MKLLLPAVCPLLVALSGIVHGQGALAPPGAPAAGQKTLQQIEPRIDLQAAIPAPGVTTDSSHHYIISQSGSYYLSANLAVTKATGIQITAANVTLDLNGFTVSTPSLSSALAGIGIANGASNCEVRHEKITGVLFQSFDGISLPSAAAGFAQVSVFRDLAIDQCNHGMVLDGFCTLVDCQIATSTSFGVMSSGPLTCVNCQAAQNLGGGFSTSKNTMTMTGCTAINNTGDGFVAYAGVFTHCRAESDSNGFNVSDHAAFDGCTAFANSGAGILCAGAGNFTNCVVEYSNPGIQGGVSSVVTACAARVNYGTGILLGNQSSAIGCTSTGNGTGHGPLTTTCGIKVLDGCTVKDCTVADNYGDGIIAGNDCQVAGNTASTNGNAAQAGTGGIHIAGSASRVEGNALAYNVVGGLVVDDDRNFIARNTVRGNSPNYVIVAGNRIARIVVPGVNAAAIAGANGGSADGYTAVDPWANFSY